MASQETVSTTTEITVDVAQLAGSLTAVTDVMGTTEAAQLNVNSRHPLGSDLGP